MDAETVYGVVKKLVGPVDPVGETQTDETRFENLQLLTDITERLLADIDRVGYENKGRVEYSMKRAGEYAGQFQTKIGIVD
jgi:hypothetical protein